MNTWLANRKVEIREHAKDLSLLRMAKARETLIPLLANAFQARRIWIFGSTARLDASEDSDMDVFVETDDKFRTIRFLDRQDIVLNVLEEARKQGFNLPCDIIPWTTREVVEGWKGSWMKTIREEGILVHERV